MRSYRTLVYGLLALAATVPAQALADTDLFCSGLATTFSTEKLGATVSDIGKAELRVHLTDTTAAATLPPIMSEKAAQTLKNLVYTDTTITAQGPMPLFGSRQSLYIDRTTGYIRLVTQSSGEFTGTCKTYDPAAATKQF